MKYRFLRYPGGKFKAVTFSYDDGAKTDIKLLEIFNKHNMKCTLNICSNRLNHIDKHLTVNEINTYVLEKGHEIANHGENHIALGITDHVRGLQDVLNCRIELEEKFCAIIRGMAYPDTMKYIAARNYEQIKAMLESVGIVYSRAAGTDNDSFELPSDFHLWMPSVHHQNEKVFDYIDAFNAIDDKKLYCASRYPRLFYMWGHSREFEKNNNWDRLESICEKLGNNNNIWYATNIEIFDYVKAYDSLAFSATGSIVYNPTLIDVWFDIDGTIYCVKSGETVKIKQSK